MESYETSKRSIYVAALNKAVDRTAVKIAATDATALGRIITAPKKSAVAEPTVPAVEEDQAVDGAIIDGAVANALREEVG